MAKVERELLVGFCCSNRDSCYDEVNAAATVNTQPLYRSNVASQAQSDGCGTTWCSIA